MTERLTIADAAGRRKAYRPLPAETRATALAEGLAAYERGDFFEAHELLEPAWMGTADPAERALLQGLIKLAAAFVHDVRGNPTGMRKNLLGARARLVEGQPASGRLGIDAAILVAEIDRCLARPSSHHPPTIPRRTA